MSTKTSIKRIALVAVSALGFGLLSGMPAKAAFAQNDVIVPISVSLTNTNTTLAGRVGQQVSIAITGTWTSGSAASTSINVVSVAAAITSQPATSNVYASLAQVTAPSSGLTLADGGLLVTDAKAVSAGSAITGTASSVATLNYYPDTNTATGAGTNATLANVLFTPTVAGTYSLTVWNERDRTWGAVNNATPKVATAATQSSLSGSESSRTFTINVSSGVSSITLTPTNARTAMFESSAAGLNGSLIRIQLRDAAGNAAILAPGESVTLTPSGTGDIDRVNGVAVTSAAGAAYNLASTDFNASGIAWINLIDTTAGTTNLTAAIAGGANASTSITFVDTVAAGSNPLSISSLATGWATTGSAAIRVPIGSSTVTFRASAASGSAVGFAVNETVNNGAGAITGYTTALAYDCVGISAGSHATCSVTANTAADSDQAYTISANATAAYSASSGDEAVVTALTNRAGALTLTPGNVNAVVGATTTFLVNLKDVFGRNYANQTLSSSVTGKNPTTTARLAVTDASGNATFTVTDANTNTAVSDTHTVSVSGGSTASATIAYGTNAVGTIALDWPGEDDVVAGTTFTEITAAAGGATGTSATVTAIVTGSTGALLAGVPVTFSVSGLTGAEVHTTKVTVYTNTSGEASTSISSYAAGKATVTATAGGKSLSADIYFAQTGTAEARTIAAAVNGSVVTATVRDRYGNTIPGVTVNATRSGTGYFGSGASTAQGQTDKNGQVEFIFTGTGTVTVAFTSATFGQSADAAGYVGGNATTGTAVTASAAGTSTTNQTGLGAALAPAGVNSASVAVSSVDAAAAAADAAADAAAEAIDAANAATDAANLAAEAADAATVAAEEARDAADAATAAVEELATQVATLMAALKAQITTLANTVAKIAKKVRA